MAADCEETRARMLELIYGELPAEARAQAETHLAGCAACRAELAALRATRALARGRLGADAPPTRARAAILQAAAAAVPARPRVPAAAGATQTPSFWTRLRGKWTLPTFATIGAVAVFLLASRIFLEPEKTYQRGRQGLAPAETGVAPPASAPTATPSGAAAEARAPAGEREAEPAAKPADRPAGHRHRAPARRSEEAERADSNDVERLAAPAPEPATGGAAPGAFAPPPPAAGHRAYRAVEDDQQAPSAISADRSSAAKKSTMADDGFAAAPAAAPSPPPAASQPAAAGHESPAARADRLFAQRRWVEAAVAYRELLRDDPGNANAPRWRQRLAACDAASASAP